MKLGKVRTFAQGPAAWRWPSQDLNHGFYLLSILERCLEAPGAPFNKVCESTDGSGP